MKALLTSTTMLAMASLSFGQFFEDFEAYNAGNIVGQGGYAIQSGSTGAGMSVDTSIFSPMGGSTRSLAIRGTGASQRVWRNLGTTITTGTWTIGWDLRVLPRGNNGLSTTNIIARVRMDGVDNNFGQQIFQPYFQNGGSGINSEGAQNGFSDTDGLGGSAYAGTGLVPGFTYDNNNWYRFEFQANFNTHTLTNFTIYDISTGTRQQVAQNTATLYFNNNGTNQWYSSFGSLAFGLDTALADEGLNIDNVSAVPEPATMAVLGLGLLAMRRRRRA